MFGKFVKGIGIITTISLLHTSISDASESPVTIANKEKNSSISTKYQPSGVMLTTDQGKFYIITGEIIRLTLLLCLK